MTPVYLRSGLHCAYARVLRKCFNLRRFRTFLFFHCVSASAANLDFNTKARFAYYRNCAHASILVHLNIARWPKLAHIKPCCVLPFLRTPYHATTRFWTAILFQNVVFFFCNSFCNAKFIYYDRLMNCFIE